MGFIDGFLDIADGSRPASFEQLRSEIDVAWIDEALKLTGKQSIRRRVLPNDVVVWLVLGMAVFCDRAIEAVVKHLGLPVMGKDRGPSPTGSPVGSDTITKARRRVGAEPLECLFGIATGHWLKEFASEGMWKGLQLLCIDGSTVRIPDTPENETVYGRPGSSRSTAGYPQARVLGLLAIGSRILVDFVVGMLGQSEQELVELLWKKLPARALVILDRGFVNYAMFARIPQMGTQCHWLCRAKSRMKYKVVQVLGSGDQIVELEVPAKQRKVHPTLPAIVTVRMLEYRLHGFGSYRLLTSLTDAATYQAQEVIELYHKRWEIEIAYAEIKTQMLDRREAIRSKTADGIHQELWGLAIAYNVVRVMMARAAQKAGVSAYRLSFRNSLLHIRSFLLSACKVAPQHIPRLYDQLCEDLTLLLLPERRERHFPRVVKIKMTSYKRNKSKDGQEKA